MTCAELIDEVTKDGILKNVSNFSEDLDDNEKNEIEEAILLHLDIYKKTLVEILKEIPLSLYNKLDARTLDAIRRDIEIKEVELLSMCGSINNEEMKRCIEVSNKTIFSCKSWQISLMMGRVNEIVNETRDGWDKFFQENPDFITSQEEFAKETTPTIPDISKGKGILGSLDQIMNELAVKSKTDESVQTKPTETTFVQFEKVKIDNVQDTDNIVDNTPPVVIDTTPSGEATSAKEDEKRDTPREDKVKETDKTPNTIPIVDYPTKLLAIDTSQVEKKSITEMNPTKLMKEGSIDKGIIDQSIIVLHRLIPDCMIKNEASPSSNLKALTKYISKNFQSLQQISDKKALERFTLAKKAAFDQIIETKKRRVEEKLVLIENSLKQCTNIYRVYCNIEILIANVDKWLKELHEQIANISNSFDGLTSLTTSILLWRTKFFLLKRKETRLFGEQGVSEVW